MFLNYKVNILTAVARPTKKRDKYFINKKQYYMKVEVEITQAHYSSMHVVLLNNIINSVSVLRKHNASITKTIRFKPFRK